MAHQRMSTTVIGCALCFAINVIVFPVWAGDDLHNSILRNMEGLAESLEECITTYFVDPNDDGKGSENDVPRGCKYVLNSKATEESLVNFATWEPPHGIFFFRYPWNLYEKVGSMTRHYAYCVDALDEFLKSEIQVPFSVIENLRTPCFELGRESANILHELAESIKTTRRNTNARLMIDRLRAVVENLQNSMRAQPELFLDTKKWRIVEEKPLKTQLNFPEDIIRSDKFYASSLHTNGLKEMSFRTTLGEEEIREEKSRDRSGKICEMKEMKRSSYAFLEVLPLASFSALLIETLARLESLIMAVEELGEEAKFKSTDKQVKEYPPSTSSTKPTRSLTSTKQIVPVAICPTASLVTIPPTSTPVVA